MQGHIRSILPQKGGVAPVDNNTVALFRYDKDAGDTVGGLKPIGESQALSFDLSSSPVEFPGPIIQSNDFTVAAWFNVKDLASYRAVFGQYASTDPGRFWFGIDDTGFGYRIGSAIATVPIEVNKWVYGAVSRKDGQATIYVNGVAVRTDATNSSLCQQPSFIGSYHERSGIFNGSISNVSIWNKGLSQEEVLESMGHKYSNGLVGLWRLGEGQGTIAYDYSNHGNDGIISNVEWGEGQNQYRLIDEGVLLEEETTNIIPLESLTFESGWSDYGGATIKRIQGVFNAEWDTNEATRIQVSGGTNVIVSHIDLMSHTNIESGRRFAVQVKIKNLGANTVYVYSNRQSTYINSGIVRAGESRTVKWVTDSNPAGSGGNLQIQFRNLAADVGKELDFLAFEPQIEEKTYHTSFVSESRKNSNLNYLNPLRANSDFTISLWIRPFEQNQSFGSNQILTVASLDTENINTFNIDIFQNKFRAFLYDSTGNSKIANSGVSPTPEEWKHIVVAKDEVSLRIYVNGVLEDSVVMQSLSYEWGDTVAIGERIGAGSSYNGRFLNGIIDELRIDKIARTAEEIQAWYHHGRGMM